jgi:hypothetical protein
VVLFCDISESAAHVKGRCPLLKKAKSTYALTCGYTVDDLGFYYIPNSVAISPRTVMKTTLVRVVEGNMNAMQIRLELERLVPAKVNWEVEEIEKNIFKTVFPSKGDMIEWGELQTEDRKAKLVIEELSGGSSIKQVMKKVWEQMSKLPNELRDYLTIWAIGTILRVTKDVDMSFTRQYNRPKMQVLVLDPALIPSSMNVVIGDNVYELHFRVEPEDMQDAPKPLDTEDDSDEFNKKEEEAGV